MTSVANLHQQTTALRRAAVRATLAPSVHNTQPWRFRLGPNQLEMYLDRNRQLRELDPTGRQLVISCGCALLNARVALAAAGATTEVERFPDPMRPDLFARITTDVAATGYVDPIAVLDGVLEARRTNRRSFSDDEVPVELVIRLEEAAASEGAVLYPVNSADERDVIALLSQRADGIQNLSPAYRAEVRAWTTDDPRRLDGVQAGSVPRVDGTSGDDVPMRDFDMRGNGLLPAATHSTRQQCLLLLGTVGDGPDRWLRAGEALERMLLEITRLGYAASPLTQIVEVPSTRAALRSELRLVMYPHILLRVGRAPAAPSPRRRRLVDVLDESL